MSILLRVTLGVMLVVSAGVMVEPAPFDPLGAHPASVAAAIDDPAFSASFADPVAGGVFDAPPADDRSQAAATAPENTPVGLGAIVSLIAGRTDRLLLTAASAAGIPLPPSTEQVTTDVPEKKLTKKEQKAAERKARKARKRAKQRAKPSTERRLKLVKSISGGLSPKSIVSAQNGKVFAMNMMYGHTITVFNKRYRRARVISDEVNLSKYGFSKYRKPVRGAPVEAALAPDGKHMYVSNYSMYGPGFDDPGFDLCTPSDRIDRGFVYEIDTRRLRKTDVIRVGEVPKYLAVSPNGRYLLVGNWCSWDISVVDLRKGKEVRRIEAGVAPRGMAFSPNGKLVYVTLVGEDKVLVIDMKTFRVKREISDVGERPRHLVMSRDGRFLYITVQGKDKLKRVDGHILKYDTRKRRIVKRSKALKEPRTTVLSRDGRSLYVVDYHRGSIVKMRTRDLKVIQEMHLGYHPIGVTYDLATDKVWVAGYGGSVWVLKDR